MSGRSLILSLLSALGLLLAAGAVPGALAASEVPAGVLAPWLVPSIAPQAPDETAPRALGAPLAPGPPGRERGAESAGDELAPDEGGAGPAAAPTLADPLEPVNRLFFAFNDKAYFWVVKPVARAYRAVIPEPARVSVRNFFSNVATPVRLVNNLGQGKVRDAGVELLRFVINTTVGVAGLFDPARNRFRLEKREEDLGLTLGRYGLGHGPYVVLPLLGPSSLRDAAGLVGDGFLDPVNYVDGFWTVVGVKAFKSENETSLSIGTYEDLVQTSLDPYVAVRDAYDQYRRKSAAR